MEAMQKPLRVAAIGELLWDLLPDGPQLGGAPANFAAMLAQMSFGVDEQPRGRSLPGELASGTIRLDCKRANN